MSHSFSKILVFNRIPNLYKCFVKRSSIVIIVGFIKKNYHPFFVDVMSRYLPRISIVLVKFKMHPKPRNKNAHCENKSNKLYHLE